MHTATRPYSPHFEEHYWSGGAAEKTHVYLHGNNLPARLAAARAFTVAELGFGTGLAFLLTAALWQRVSSPSAHLTYISYELHPLLSETLHPIHATFPPDLQPLSAQLLALPRFHPGWNVLPFLPNLTLHLYAGDATDGLATHPVPADAWFLDGFSPARNPSLWTPSLLHTVALNTSPAGTASTYSVARAVREALTAAGFQPAKTPGFPPKQHMLTAQKTSLEA